MKIKMTIPVEVEVWDRNMSVVTGKHVYLVAECRGGLMEDPDIHYHNYQLIRADSEDKARRTYSFLNDCSYFYVSVIRQIE